MSPKLRTDVFVTYLALGCFVNTALGVLVMYMYNQVSSRRRQE